MLFTDVQMAQLRQLIIDYHAAFSVNFFGPKTVPEATLARLKELGLVNLQGNNSQNAFLYGKLLNLLNTPQAAQMTLSQVQAYLKTNPLPLTRLEQQAVDIAAARASQFIAGLGNRIATDTGELVINGDAELRRQMQTTINSKVSQGIAQRQSVKQIKSEIGHATGDWTRDLDRIAATETSRAMNQGLAAQLRSGHGEDVEVAVLSRKGCCPECAKAYVGPDGAPIIFKLDDLEANGSNYKVPKADKKPVVPPYHPNCACSLVRVPKNAGFNADNQMVPGGTRGIRPHGQTAKSMAAGELMKADGMNWWGLKIRNVGVAASNGARKATVDTPTGNYPCLLGASAASGTAYVAHAPHGDVMCLGFGHVDQAKMALAGSRPQAATSQFSEIPLHELVSWAAGPKETFVLEPAAPTTAVAKSVAPDARFVLPVVPPQRPRTALPPKGMAIYDASKMVRRTRKVRPKPMLGAFADAPHERKKPKTGDGLRIREDKDDPVAKDTRIVIARRIKRTPVTLLRPAP